jgi:cytochrome P450
MPRRDEIINIDDYFHQHTQDVLFQARERSPVHRVRYPDGEEAWLITRYEDVKAVCTDPRVSRDLHGLHALEQAGTANEPGSDAEPPEREYRWMFESVLYMNPPDHTR